MDDQTQTEATWSKALGRVQLRIQGEPFAPQSYCFLSVEAAMSLQAQLASALEEAAVRTE